MLPNLHALDLAIIAAYVVLTVGVGVWISRRASKNLNSYFLGGNAIPWYMLGLSNASGMFDISGTMWLVYLLFVYGLKSVWIPWLWPVFNQIFLMVYLSVWLRRSGVMTGAEWIRFRFGEGRGATLAHFVVVFFALISVVGFLAYGFIGIGKFAATFLPWRLSPDPDTNTNLYGIVVTALTTVYVVKGGMYSVVVTEVMQFVIKTVACVWVGALALHHVSPGMLDAVIPAGWRDLGFGWRLGLDWSTLIPEANRRIAQDGWTLFGAFFMMTVFKGVLLSMAGPAPNYDMQRILSAKTPREAAKMSGLVSLALFVPRYMLIAGLAVLGLVFFSGEFRAMGPAVDFERVLPLVMRDFIPQGLLGLLIAGLLAAYMGTYAATVNAAPAYVVNDIYKRYVNPNASDKTYVRMSYAVSLAVVVIGTSVGLFVESLNTIVQWIVAALFGGYTASNVLKWYWWRFNAYGYFWGMAGGIAGAALVPLLLPDVTEIYAFPAILAVSLAGCLAGSLLTRPDDEHVLDAFYLKVRPWGAWGPVHARLAARYPDLQRNRDFPRDAFNVGVGVVWQTALVAAGIYLVLEDWTALAVCAGLIAATMAVLKVSWYDRIEDYPPMPAGAPAVAASAGAAPAVTVPPAVLSQ